MSAAIAEVVELLGQLTTGGAVARGRAAVQATHLVSRLTGAEKRELAIAVAERVAPQLVPRIEAETGTDLTPAQVSALLDMFRRMDADQVAELRDAIKERDLSAPVVQQAVDDAMAISGAPPPAALEAAHAPSTETDQETALTHADAEHQAALTRAQAEQQAALARAEAERDAAIAAAEQDKRDALARLEETRKAALAKAAAGLAVAREAIRGGRGDTADATGATDGSDERSPSVALGDLDLDWDFDVSTPVETPVADTSSSGRPRATATAAEAATARLAGVRARAALDHPGPAKAHGVVAEVADQPTGFRRRRAAQRAIAEGAVMREDAVALCRLFDRPGDRTWVAGDLVAAELLSIADLRGLLPPRAAARLAARMDR